MSKKQVFVVEGRNLSKEEISRPLEHLGFLVAGVANCRSHIADEILSIAPDVVIADSSLCDGALTHEIIGPCCSESSTPVLYVIGSDSSAIPVDKLAQGVCCKLYKPWTETELKQRIESAIFRGNMERQLRESEERFRLFYENSPIAYQSLNEDGTIRDVNPAWCEMLGCERAQVAGKKIEDFLAPESRANFSKSFETYKQSGKIRAVQQRMLRSDGTEICVEADGNISRSANGRVLQTHCVLRNVTERKLMEDERERYHRILETKNRELEQIIHIASHDLRSPLVTIRGFGIELADACGRIRELLADVPIEGDRKADLKALLQEDVPESLQFITAGADKMDSLISSLLRLARLGTAAVEIERLDMNSLVDKIRRSIGFQIQEKGADVFVDDLPDCRGDSVQISQLFSNLFDNAIKYLDPGRKGQVRVTGRVDCDQVEYCVEDNGCGIESDQLDKIFKIFYRLNSGGADGEGLGLTIVKRIVNGHGGEVRVESEPGAGSKFYVSLPAVGG